MAVGVPEMLTLIGTTVLQESDGSAAGVVTDALASEDGKLQEVRLRVGRFGGEKRLPLKAVKVTDGSLFSSLNRRKLAPWPEEGLRGLSGLEVRSSEGETLGKIANIMVEPPGWNIVGLQLSNGLMRDWARGRIQINLEPDDRLGDHRNYLVLPANAEMVERGVVADQTDGLAPTNPVSPIDWDRVRNMGIEEIQEVMARVVWERRGAPQEQGGPQPWLDYVADWARGLKAAADAGGSRSFDDLAVLSSDEVEALAPFRMGASPLDRHVPAEPAAECGAPADTGAPSIPTPSVPTP